MARVEEMAVVERAAVATGVATAAAAAAVAAKEAAREPRKRTALGCSGYD